MQYFLFIIYFNYEMQVAHAVEELRVKERTRIGGSVNSEGPRLLSFIRKKVRSIEDAEDILQDIFVQLVNSYDTIRNPENLTAWLYGVARNKISDYTKKKRVVPFAEFSQEEDHHMPELMLLFESNPEDVMFSRMIRKEIETAIESLPASQREVFVRNEIEGESFKSISADLAVPMSTLLSRKRYAVLQLREQLQYLFDELTDKQ